MATVTIKEERCKGCGLCIDACPKKVLALAKDHINAKGYRPASVVAPEKCIACAFCGRMCPDCVITVER